MEKKPKGGGRPVGDTESSWCRAVPGGTGITVLAILLSKNPGVHLLQNALEKLQGSHPVLCSKLRYLKSENRYEFVSHPSPTVQIKSFDLNESQKILDKARSEYDGSALPSPIHLILEHELNRNSWNHRDGMDNEEENVMHGSLYELPEGKWAVALRLHVVACDRRTAVFVLEEFLVLVAPKDEHEVTNEGTRLAIGPSIEDVMPSGKTCRKNLIDHGLNLLRHWLSSLKLDNLMFDKPGCPRTSRVVRLKLSVEHTTKILSKCETRKIKLCGVLAASALLAAYKSDTQGVSNENPIRKYRVVTLVDCRPILNPPPSQQDLGFYQSAILNTHDVKRGESLWDTAEKAYMAFQSFKAEDMQIVVNIPGLTTSSSSLRTSLVSVFEDPMIDKSSDARNHLGVEDYMGCASVHGIGPSLAIFDTVRDGSLDCVCVFPAPLHFPKRMQDIADQMKVVLIEAAR